MGVEQDLLIQAAKDPEYRNKVKKIFRAATVSPFTHITYQRMWDLLEGLGQRDKLTKEAAESFCKDFSSEDREEVLNFAQSALSGEAEAPDYALDSVRKFVKKSVLTISLGEAIDALEDGKEDVLKDSLSKGLRVVTGGAVENDWDGEEGGNWFEGFKLRQEKRKEEKDDPDRATVVPTRIHTIDKIFGGGPREPDLCLVTGRTNIGKSFVMGHISFAAAAQSHLCIHICTEMSKMEIDTRFDARLFGRETGDFYKFDFSPEELIEFEERRERTSKALKENLWTYSVPIDTLNRFGLIDLMDEVQDTTGRKVKVICIDTADQMLPDRFIKEERLRHKKVYENLKRVAREHHLVVWSSAHVPGSEEKELLGELDLSESKDKGKLASRIITLNQTAAERRHGIIRAYVPKNRNGPRGHIAYLETDFARAQIREVSKATAEKKMGVEEEEDE